ncbi:MULTISPECIES: DsbA family protein [Vibrio]|uniref:DsbA family protein n=1 Tax=Vibrio TaxID=662 RepID=UPI002075BBBC|nr:MULTISPECIES: DsbA family protein [Vibrio]USD31219.1 DsbA family protein [Vibrio sp. SCSIO 43186]USD44264.1 DsbA family protein [Vibrio sp. SCSIO 43145]USD68342.1 DsbA family protein [Vibrio sp. SCSIO 43139]USD96025.1 protein-disulfide isomerase [Vibrio coralliilyticus]
MVKVHVFYDPMCGWCYGATPLMEMIENHAHFDLCLHPGGMVSYRSVKPDFRQHILHSDKHISERTDAKFGESYLSKVASNKEFILDSFLPTRAILLAESLGISSLKSLKEIQRAHYFDGSDITQPAILAKVMQNLGGNLVEWHQALANQEQPEIAKIKASKQLMKALNVTSYPTFVAESDGQYISLQHSDYYGNPALWLQHLEHKLLNGTS